MLTNLDILKHAAYIAWVEIGNGKIFTYEQVLDYLTPIVERDNRINLNELANKNSTNIIFEAVENWKNKLIK